MSEKTDPGSEEVTYFNLPAKTVVLEIARASYALGLGAVVMATLVGGVYVLGVESQRAATATVFSTGFLLPVVLYAYDRHHKQELVIADFAHAIVRPVGVLYRIFKGP